MQKAPIKALFCVMVFTGVAYQLFIPHGPSDKKAYEELLAASSLLHSRVDFRNIPLNLERRGVQKKIYQEDTLVEVEYQMAHARLQLPLTSLKWEEKAEEWVGSLKGEKYLHFTAKNGILNPEGFQLMEEVQFSTSYLDAKQTQGIADCLFYKYSDKKVELTSCFPRRVLLWQEDLTLSAPEVVMENGKVQGKGDVRFTLTLQEKQTLSDAFSQFL